MDETTSYPSTAGAGRILTDEDVRDDAERRAEVYSRKESEGVAVVDGYGARIAVEKGHLELVDGVGEHRRNRRFAKVNAPLRVAVGIGTAGILTFDALRWCRATGTSVVVLGRDGALLAAGPEGRRDARLLRAQALALYTDVGVEISRYLITEKLRGQARVLGLVLQDEVSFSTVDELATEVSDSADSIEEMRQIEAAAANAYFAAWERTVRVVFVGKDVPRIPKHWTRFNGRRSSLNPGTPRSATDPAGAVLNYAYRLAEIEASLAARRMGLDPDVGILHADVAGRPSFACDLMEPIRPVVDLHVLGLLGGPLRKREFTEDERGVVRCLAPITHHLAEAMPSYGHNVGPVVERVASMLGESSPYDVTVPRTLSHSKHKAAARRRSGTKIPEATSSGRGPNPGGLSPRRARKRSRTSEVPALPIPICRGCGAQLPLDSDRDRPRIDWCSECLPERRREIGASLSPASQTAARRIEKETGDRPTHSPTAQEARSQANVRQREEQRRWVATGHESELDVSWYEREILPRLAPLSLPTIAKATGASTTAASQWRTGRRVPHRRHWTALAEVVSADLPETLSQASSTLQRKGQS